MSCYVSGVAVVLKEAVSKRWFCRSRQDLSSGFFLPWSRGYKTFFVLNSAEHEILNNHKHENIKKFSIFQAQISLECYCPANKC